MVRPRTTTFLPLGSHGEPTLSHILCTARRAGLLLGLAGLLAPAAASGLPLISEVLYDAPGSDDGEGFIELVAAPGTDLSGYELRAINGSGGGVTASLLLAGTVGADGVHLIADLRADGSTNVAGADEGFNFDLQNGPDSLLLIGPSGVVDALGYGVFGPGEVFAGEGTPAPDVAPGESLARLPADRDRDDNGLDFVALAQPTPGAAVFSAPEPRMSLLMGVLLPALFFRVGSRARPARREGALGA